jgi:ABC-type uncharacterized transport system involved in gliding motility auxiliary subunit
MTQKKQLETFLFSTAGVAVMFLIVVAVYVIAGAFKTRFDLTQEKLYTLSPGTKAILNKLDTPVEIRFYCTQDAKEMPVQLKTYAERIEDLLNEYKKNSHGKIQLKKLDPKPDSDAEDSANLDGVEGVTLGGLGADKIYLGAAINQLDSKVAIPFFAPERERLLEYDVSRAISRVTTPAKPVIGVMSALPIFGEMNPMMMRMGQMQRQDPWVFIGELKRDFEVKQVEMTADQIPSDVKVLVVVHPKGITDKAQFAIDQFVLRGGKLVAFLDPFSIVDSRNSASMGMNQLQAAQMPGSTMDKLLKAWGLSFDNSKVVADMNYVSRINRGARGEAAPAVLSLTQDALDRDDVVTSEIDNALIPYAGVFTGTPAEGLKETVLMKTSKESQLIDRFMAEFAGEQSGKDFVASGKEQALAVRLTGKFKTAFPDGKPKDTAENKDDKKDDTKKEPASTETPLKASTTDGVVILVGDSDLLWDQVAVQITDFLGQRIIQPRNGNLNLVQNMVEQLAGDSNLIAVRSRATMNRPFLLVRKMQAQAEERWRNKLKDLDKSLSDTQTRLSELQKSKESGQRFILTPEQQAEIKNFQKKQAEVKKELKVVRRNLRQDTDSLENRLKWINIAGMPLLVTISGLSLALIKKKKTAAK